MRITNDAINICVVNLNYSANAIEFYFLFSLQKCHKQNQWYVAKLYFAHIKSKSHWKCIKEIFTLLIKMV